MSVTQAGRGGMEWLAGGRLPSWASPYSAQATAALKDAFSAEQWPTIRDYGFAHPEIVGYMNAYAPEDAKIAYSLVPTLGYDRWIANGGTGHIDTGFIANNYAHSYQYDMVWKAAAIRNNTCIIGTVSNGAAFGNVYFPNNADTCQVWGAYNWVDTQLTFNVAANTKYTDSIKFDFDSNKGYRTLNGSSLEKNVDMRTRTTTSPYLFAYNNAGSAGQKANCSFAKVVMYGDGVKVREMYPFIRNGVNGMIDVLSGTFYQNAGSGSFTISETPAS